MVDEYIEELRKRDTAMALVDSDVVIQLDGKPHKQCPSCSYPIMFSSYKFCPICGQRIMKGQNNG